MAKILETVVTHLEMTTRPAKRLRAPTGMYLAMMRTDVTPGVVRSRRLR